MSDEGESDCGVDLVGEKVKKGKAGEVCTSKVLERPTGMDSAVLNKEQKDSLG